MRWTEKVWYKRALKMKDYLAEIGLCATSAEAERIIREATKPALQAPLRGK